MRESPVRLIREELKLTRTALAVALGVDVGLVSRVEAGLTRSFSPKFRDGLMALGLWTAELPREQARYCDAVREEIVNQVKRSELVKSLQP